MKYFRLDVDNRVTLYPIVCAHVGAQQCAEDFIKEHVERIADDPNGRWVYLGDGGECVTVTSKGEIYNQRYSPDDQITRFVELMEPIRGKGLFGISGNHDRRISKLSGIDWTHALCSRLGIPYLGVSAFMRLALNVGKSATHAQDLFWHHGVDSSSVLGGKVNAAKRLDALVDCDAIFSAHSHICTDLPPTYRAYIDDSGAIQHRPMRSFVCGCAYDSRVPGYAEEKGYQPILPAWLSVTFGFAHKGHGAAKRRYPKMDCTIYRADP